VVGKSVHTLAAEWRAHRTLGQRVLWLRERAGLSQEELGRALDTAKTTVGRMEGDKVEPSITLVQRLASLYGIGVDDLLGGVKVVGGRRGRPRNQHPT
jgi:transcriptional regulator with XRE-family HTH domain